MSESTSTKKQENGTVGSEAKDSRAEQAAKKIITSDNEPFQDLLLLIIVAVKWIDVVGLLDRMKGPLNRFLFA